MRIQKFQAANMQEALASVKREFGADAMVLSTRQIRRGLLNSAIEVTAAIEHQEEKTAPAKEESPAPTASLTEPDIERIILPIRSELRALRTLLRRRGDGDAGADKGLRTELAALRSAVAGLQATDSGRPPIEKVAETTRLVASSRARVVALVGPTGVGKTTTIAKLAARAALVQRRRVAIISLDNYRVGGEEQIRIFSDLIGVPLFVLRDGLALAERIDELDPFDRIFVDTAGHSPRDDQAMVVLGDSLRNVRDLEIHLTLPAATSPASIDRIYSRYQKIGVHRLLFTKLDEADDLAELVYASARVNKPVTYVTTGQAVPEDLEEVTAGRLVELATNGLHIHAVAA